MENEADEESRIVGIIGIIVAIVGLIVIGIGAWQQIKFLPMLGGFLMFGGIVTALWDFWLKNLIPDIPIVGDILDVAGNVVEDVVQVAESGKTCEDAFSETKDDGFNVFVDAVRQECWACPPGYERTASGVTDKNACVKNDRALTLNTVVNAAETRAPSTPSCPSGWDQFFDACLGPCPSGYRENLVQTDPAKRCFKCPSGTIIPGVCPGQETFKRQPTQLVSGGGCPSGWVTKDVLGAPVKCLKPPDHIVVPGGGGRLTKIGNKDVSDPSNWVPVLLNDTQLRLSSSAIAELEKGAESNNVTNADKAWDIAFPQTDLMLKCPIDDDLEFTSSEWASVNEEKGIGTFERKSQVTNTPFLNLNRRTANPDFTAPSACEQVSTAINLGSVEEAKGLLEQRAEAAAVEEGFGDYYNSGKRNKNLKVSWV